MLYVVLFICFRCFTGNGTVLMCLTQSDSQLFEILTRLKKSTVCVNVTNKMEQSRAADQ